MKRMILGLLLVALNFPAHAGTIVVTIAGFSNLPAAAPSNWPSATVTYPGAVSPNTARTYTMNDADFQAMLTWLASTQLPLIETVMGLTPPITLPITPTAPQIWQTWPQIWVNGTKGAVQNFFTPLPAPPPPITIQ
jgi:hypothetical protein